MKKLSTLLCVLLCVALLAVSVSAELVQEGTPDASKLPAGSLIYKETFDGSASDTESALALLGWKKVEDFKPFTANFKVEDGVLKIDNLNGVENSADSYALIMDDAYLANVCNGDYSYQYEVTYRDAGNAQRYISLLCNYDGMNNYNTADMRIAGNGFNQVRKGDAWLWYNDATDCPLTARGEDSLSYMLTGEEFDGTQYLVQDFKLTIRVVMSQEKGPTMYVNDILASEMVDHIEEWGTLNAHSAICFKASTLVVAEIDNLMVWTGTTEAPVEPEPETEAPAEETKITAEETEAPSDDPSPVTADIAVIAAGIALAAAAVVVFKKH